MNGLPNVSTSLCNTLDESNLDESIDDYTGTVKCGVCGKELDGADWLCHIKKEHNYVAWVEGKKSLVSMPILINFNRTIKFSSKMDGVNYNLL